MTENLKTKFYDVLVGFEQFSFTEEQLDDVGVTSGLEMAQADMKACKECDGDGCMTMINYSCINPYWHIEQKQAKCGAACYSDGFRGYYALHKAGCKQYGRPSFAVYKCPGPEERKTKILQTSRPKEKWQEAK